MRALANLLANIPETDDVMPYFAYRIMERLASYNHRNQASLNALGLGRILFERLYIPEHNDKAHSMPHDTRIVMHRLLKKMLGAGARTKDARMMFRRAVREDDTLDSLVVETLRTSMRVKWPEHFSFEGVASLELREDNMKGMVAPHGFTFMVCLANIYTLILLISFL